MLDTSHLELLDDELIIKATEGDEEALKKILDIYQKHIKHYATITLYDKEGSPVSVVDSDLKHEIIQRIIVRTKKFKRK